jgi:isoleucyl-tRNA synthetase
MNPAMQAQLEKVEDLIKAEVNIKEIQYISTDNDFIRKKVKPNFVLLGKKLGAKMKQVSGMITSLGQAEIRRLENAGELELLVDNEPVTILLSEVDVQSEDVPGWMVASKNALTVALDIQVSPELEQEGNARELVNRIQKIRKDNGYELTDRILVKVSENDRLIPSITQYNAYICAEILADTLEFVPQLTDGIDIEVNEIQLKVFVSKKG